jgi:hypothetical protein
MKKTKITMKGKIEKIKQNKEKYFYCISDRKIKTYDQVGRCYKCANNCGKEFNCPAILLDMEQSARYKDKLDNIIKGGVSGAKN